MLSFDPSNSVPDLTRVMGLANAMTNSSCWNEVFLSVAGLGRKGRMRSSGQLEDDNKPTFSAKIENKR